MLTIGFEQFLCLSLDKSSLDPSHPQSGEQLIYKGCGDIVAGGYRFIHPESTPALSPPKWIVPPHSNLYIFCNRLINRW